ncbi:BglG family transcription antiterminator [Vagococcus carniphilus]|uniref:Uncharacterized protein n=1 Tax=Vagococcus carniphilus TaxID=218144 RepID=A0A430AMB1_9ENTE|nr:BglG family transcription antiterminator [Vagococcus carniphilus]QNN72616.1 transcription antiterminator [Vagococcus carniphilus]RSU09290.1 hypothetical protein CBF28_14995 [Vagococcus carniphilus]
MNISDRQMKIIKLLENSQGNRSSEDLAEELKVSSKTIKNDIKVLKSFFGDEIIEAKPGIGYQLNKSLINLEKIEYKNEDFEILNILINQPTIDLYELADKVYISEATLLRKVALMNELIEKEYDFLGIERKNNLLYIKGEENKRKIFNLFLNKELDSHTLDLSKYQFYFKNCDIKQLTQIIFDFHQTIHLNLNDFSTVSFVLHMAVLIERINKKQFLNQFEEIKLDEKSYDLARQLIKELKKELSIDIPNEEIYYVAKLYSTKVVDSSIDQNEMIELVEAIVTSIDKNYFIQFNENEEFKNFLNLHLISLYTRAKENKFLPNPLTEELKLKYPFIYTVTVYATSIIQKSWNLTIPDSEIGYIALHFLSAYKSMKNKDSKKVVLISSLGKGGMLLVERQLNLISSFSFQIVSHQSIFDKSGIPENVDLVLSTVKLAKENLPHVYYFNQMLTAEDLKQIEKIVSTKKELSIFDKYFHKDLFFSQCSFSNKEEVITFLCKKLEKQGFCQEDYLQKVLDREEISSTSYGNYYAIPHAIKREATENAIAVCSLKKPIYWGTHKVKIIFLLSLKTERDESFEALFDQLFYLLEKKEIIKKLAGQESYEGFMALCNEVYSEKSL